MSQKWCLQLWILQGVWCEMTLAAGTKRWREICWSSVHIAEGQGNFAGWEDGPARLCAYRKVSCVAICSSVHPHFIRILSHGQLHFLSYQQP